MLVCREERRVQQTEQSPWYGRPMTWSLIGAGAVAVAVSVILAVRLSSRGGGELDAFCPVGDPECVRLEGAALR